MVRTSRPLDDSTRSLGSGAFAQVGFDPQGEMLVVTDRGENEILVYQVDRRGLPSMNAAVSMSNGLVPFGFTFDRRGHLLVSEAGSGAASSYRILPDGTLSVISPSVANGQAATCWIMANRRGDVFTANTASGTVSAYQLMAGITVPLADHLSGSIGYRWFQTRDFKYADQYGLEFKTDLTQQSIDLGLQLHF